MWIKLSLLLFSLGSLQQINLSLFSKKVVYAFLLFVTLPFLSLGSLQQINLDLFLSLGNLQFSYNRPVNLTY